MIIVLHVSSARHKSKAPGGADSVRTGQDPQFSTTAPRPGPPALPVAGRPSRRAVAYHRLVAGQRGQVRRDRAHGVRPGRLTGSGDRDLVAAREGTC